jgi:hypothetical protein
MAGDNSGLVVGGGGSSYGLWLDRDLNNGTTGPSTTFANPPLISHANLSNNTFTVSSIEIYGFRSI